MKSSEMGEKKEKHPFDQLLDNPLIPDSFKQSMVGNATRMLALQKAGYKEYLSLRIEVSAKRLEALTQLVSGKNPMPESLAKEMVDDTFKDTEKKVEELFDLVISHPLVQKAFSGEFDKLKIT